MTYLRRSRGIVWATPPATRAEGAVELVLAELEAQLARAVPYILIFDLSHAAIPDAVQRQKLAAHLRDNDKEIRRWVRGLGVILTRPLVRGIVTAIFWVSPPPIPSKIFSTQSEAAEWAQSLVDGARATP
jgi:hypothetical protein